MVHALLLRDLGVGGADKDPIRQSGRVLTQAGDMEEEEVLHTDPIPVCLGHHHSFYVFERHKLSRKLELYLLDGCQDCHPMHRCVFHANLHQAAQISH